jgi:hypothetical protein
MLIKPVFEVKGEFVSFIITFACCSDVRYYFLEQGVRLSAPVTDSASNRKEVVAVEGCKRRSTGIWPVRVNHNSAYSCSKRHVCVAYCGSEKKSKSPHLHTCLYPHLPQVDGREVDFFLLESWIFLGLIFLCVL